MFSRIGRGDRYDAGSGFGERAGQLSQQNGRQGGIGGRLAIIKGAGLVSRALFWLSMAAVGLALVSCALPLSAIGHPLIYVLLLALAIAGATACSSDSDSGGGGDDNGAPAPMDGDGNPMPMDSEGSPDIFVVNNNQKNQVYINSSTAEEIAFTAADADDSMRASQAVALDDLDGDGNLDAFVANSYGAEQVYLGNGDGAFSDPTDLEDEAANAKDSYAVALDDLDGDGNLDAFVANLYSANQVYLGNGDGSFGAPTDLETDTNAKSTRAVALGDFDGDGNLDAFVANTASYGDINQVYLGNGNGSFAAPTDLPGGDEHSYAVALGDFNGDSNLDALVANYGEANQVYLGDGAGSFSAPSNLPGGAKNSYAVALEDLDGDGNLDAVVVNYDETNQVYLGDENGSFSDPIDLEEAANAKSSRAVALEDLDGDGNLDAVVANAGYGIGEANQIYLGDGDGNFSDPIDLPGGDMGSYGIAIGDLDGQ